MLTHTLGFSRMGKHRELKKALEAYWKGESDIPALEQTARECRRNIWQWQQDAGLDMVPVGDFSLYDHMLDMTAMLGAVPERYAFSGNNVDPETYFLMARGGRKQGQGVTAMEMSKWFNTNYHYLVPEFSPGQKFALRSDKLFRELEEAVEAGIPAKAVLPGPFTYLYLGKSTTQGFDRFTHLDAIVDVYAAILEKCAKLCPWVQLDEPVLAVDLPPAFQGGRFRETYASLVQAAAPAKLMVATYFGSIAHNAAELADTPLAGLHVDVARAPEQLEDVVQVLGPDTALSLGVVDGRNIWRVDADKALALCRKALSAVGGERLLLAPSCSLLHVPVDLEGETALPQEVRRWMAFGLEKCRELRMLADTMTGGDTSAWLEDNRAAWNSRRTSPALRNPRLRAALSELRPEMYSRAAPYEQRRKLQEERLHLPLLPTTTIGSFPQTPEIRAARRAFKSGQMREQAYIQTMRQCIADAVAKQEALGLDVLVHGEPERNDMVEYFGEQLEGFCFTQHGWVQSYGSRCVKPPVIYGDVLRKQPMTVSWASYAQELSDKPVKGMLTGPVTILCWSFVRDDQPRNETCLQLAMAIREEVADLERAGLGVIQVDEPALREGAPLRKKDWGAYFGWAVECFRLAANGAASETQVHTHMCYSEFNEIMPWIAAMDADVISIEASRSRMELLECFGTFAYPNEIGPGIYDIHSPRVPDVDEMRDLLRRAAAVVPAKRLWVNPDCGLKTRGWEESLAALRNMVRAAALMRAEYGG